MTKILSPPLTVLVVDDDEDTGDSLAMLLRLYGHRVEVARSGTTAITQAAVDPPDVVLLDLLIPDLDGWEVARRLRAACPVRGKPPFLVAITGCATAADHTRSAEAGFHLHLLKPVDPPFLVGVLERFRRLHAMSDGDSPPEDGTTTGGTA